MSDDIPNTVLDTDGMNLLLGRRVPKWENDVGWMVREESLLMPTLIIFGGIEASSPIKANGYSKMAMSALGIEDSYNSTKVQKPFQVLSAVYSNSSEHGIDSKGVIRSEGDKLFFTNDVSGYAKAFSDKYFAPLVPPKSFSNNGGYKLLLKNLRNLNFACHSFGCLAFDMVVRGLEQEIKSKGYTDEECSQALRQVFVLKTGNPIGYRKTPVTELSLFSLQDEWLPDCAPEFLEKLKRLSKLEEAGVDNRLIKIREANQAIGVVNFIEGERLVLEGGIYKSINGGQHNFDIMVSVEGVESSASNLKDEFIGRLYCHTIQAALCSSVENSRCEGYAMIDPIGVLVHGAKAGEFDIVANRSPSSINRLALKDGHSNHLNSTSMSI
jgi:hypothetical protein